MQACDLDDLDAQRSAMMAEIDAGFRRFTAFLAALDDADLTGPTDAAGWTAKDHVAHLTAWAGSMIAVLDGRPRWEAIGVTPEVWQTITDTYDVINAAIQARHRDTLPAEVRTDFDGTHRALVARIESMATADLVRPYVHFQPWATGRDDPLYGYLLGNTVGHYDEHRGYVEEMVSARPT